METWLHHHSSSAVVVRLVASLWMELLEEEEEKEEKEEEEGKLPFPFRICSKKKETSMLKIEILKKKEFAFPW